MGMNMGGMQNHGGPPPMKKELLKVQLKGREHGFYSNLLSKIDPDNESKVEGPQAVVFFKSSGLGVDKLKEIWKVASRTSNKFLTRDEFYVALRLIAYA